MYNARDPLVVIDSAHEPESSVSLSALRGVLVANVIYGVYQTHYPLDLGIKGLNLSTLLFFLAAGLVIFPKKANAPPPKPPLRGFFYLFFAALLWSYAVGQFRDTSTSLEDISVVKNMLFAMLMYFVAYFACGDKRTRDVVFIAILFAIALVIAQIWRQALDYGIEAYVETHRASGPFGVDAGASNRAAAFLIIFLPIMAVTALHLKNKPAYRILAVVFTILGVGGAFFTYSRQAYFIIAILFFYLAARKSLLIGLAVAAMALTYVGWAPQGVIDRIEMTQQEDAQGNVKLDESTESRFIIWEAAAGVLASNPLGIGLNHFPREVGPHLPSQYDGLDAHNNYVRFATEGGVLACLTLIFLIGALFWLSRRLLMITTTGTTQLISNSFTVTVMGVALSNLYGSRFFDTDIMTPFWIFAGMSARLWVSARQDLESLTQ